MDCELSGPAGFSFLIRGRTLEANPNDRLVSLTQQVEDCNAIRTVLDHHAEYGYITMMSSASIQSAAQIEAAKAAPRQKIADLQIARAAARTDAERDALDAQIKPLQVRLDRLERLGDPKTVAYWESAKKFGELWGEYCANGQEAALGGRYVPLCTGGGPGIMEAAARGARSKDVEVIGLDAIFGNEPHFDLKGDFSASSNVRLRLNDFSIREGTLINYAHVILFWPGGYGTAWEVFEALSKVSTSHLRARWTKLILVHGEFWRPLLDLAAHFRDVGTINVGAERVEFRLGKPDPILGTSLTVPLKWISSDVRVRYRTSPRASALQWLDPPLTAGRKRPFLFSQSQAIHARSWVPCQDSPGVRVTYDATIRVPDGLAAVMAADRVSQKGDVTTFRMDKPIPPYLIALAVGDLVFRPLGQRTGVWAEPSVVDKAAAEFVDTEKMIVAAEKRFGPYRWGRYDILVLPPSFPFGGMENPKLTFATPTVLAGDRSLVALIAHELAHSWSGNLVTNATWRDFWLNEGFTTYLERRIVEDLYGADRSTMEAVLGKQELLAEIAKFAPRDEILHVDLKGRDPDEGMTRVPYEKGAMFLTKLESIAGRDKLDAFLKGYFDHFAFQSITTADFERHLRAELFPKGREPIDLHGWIEEPGLPEDAPEPKSARFGELDAMAAAWASGKTPARDLKAEGWSTPEWLHFLRALPKKLPADRMASLDNAYGLTDRGNSEIAAQWLLMAIRSGYPGADARLQEFLATIGRRKFIAPLYAELARTPEGKARAKSIYRKARPGYHPIAVETIDKLLGL